MPVLAVSACGPAQRLVELQVTAVEKNADMAALCNENVTQNGLQNRIRVLAADIREMPPVLAGSFDHVVSNPPYHNSHGTRPRHPDRAAAHMGDDTEMQDWVKAAVMAAARPYHLYLPRRPGAGTDQPV